MGPEGEGAGAGGFAVVAVADWVSEVLADMKGRDYSWPVLRMTRRMLWVVAKAMPAEMSAGSRMSMAKLTSLPSVHGLDSGVKGSQLLPAKKGAMTEELVG